MIEREHYPLKEAAKLLSCKVSDIIQLGARGKILIHAFVADLLAEPYKMLYDVPEFPFNHPVRRTSFTGYVRINVEDVLRYEANPRTTTVRGVWLPSVEGQSYYAFLLEYRPDNKELFMAGRTAKRMADMDLVIKADELDKARELVHETILPTQEQDREESTELWGSKTDKAGANFETYDSLLMELLAHFEKRLRQQASAEKTSGFESIVLRNYANKLNGFIKETPSFAKKFPGTYASESFHDHLKYEVQRYVCKIDK